MKLHKFISIHVIKAAGNSFGQALKKNYGDNFLWDRTYSHDKTLMGVIELTDKSQKVYPKNYMKYNIIHGHFGVEKYKHLNLPMITFLREPISRVISHYSYGIYRINLLQKSLDLIIPFEEFCYRTSNLMINMIGEDLKKFYFIGFTDKYIESIERFSKLINRRIELFKKNRTKIKTDIDESMIDIIKKYNQKDIELYKEAMELFKHGKR